MPVFLYPDARRISSSLLFMRQIPFPYSSQSNDAHLERPDTTDPDFELARNAIYIFQLDTLPPASSGWLAPEQQQLLGHTHGSIVHVISSDVAA